MKLSRKSRVIIFLHIKDEKELLNLTKCVVDAIDGKNSEIGLLTNLIKNRGQNFFTKLVIMKGDTNILITEEKPMTLMLSEYDLHMMLAQLEVFADPSKVFKAKYPEVMLKNKTVSLCLNYKDVIAEEMSE